MRLDLDADFKNVLAASSVRTASIARRQKQTAPALCVDRTEW